MRLMKSLKLKIILLLAIPYLLGLNKADAQVKVQVVTRTINKSIQWSPNMSLQITGERAEIYCTTHSQNTIDFKIEIIAENVDKRIAESDLRKMKWIDKVSGKTIYLRNYVEIARGETRPKSDLKVIYHIVVPEGCKVNIVNYFGKITISNIHSTLSIESKFCPINLKSISGIVDINSYLGDLSADNITGTLKFITDQSDIDINGVSGSLSIQSNLASIDIGGMSLPDKTSIRATKSKLMLETGDFAKFSFNLKLANATINKPDAMKLTFIKKDNTKIHARFNAETDYPLIDIELNTGTLTIVN